MFKMICMRRALRLASSCAILFLATSLLSTRHTIQTVDGAGHEKTTESAATSPTEENNYQVGELSGSLASSLEEGATSVTKQTESGPRHRRPAATGKIFDYLTTNSDPESRGRHHLLVPRLSSNSTAAGLMRLVVGPFKSTKSPASGSARDKTSSRSVGREEVGKSANKDTSNDENGLEDSGSRRSKCEAEPRSGGYRRVFRAARNLLKHSFASIEQRAGGLFNLGSGMLATLIPLASLISGSSGPKYQLVNSSEMALNSSTDSFAPPPKLAHYIPDSSVLQNRLELILGLLERSSQKLPTFPNLHPSECIKRSVCEAHYEPKKYGAIGWMLRTMFPAGGDENMEQTTVLNKYRRAGLVGQERRLNGTTRADLCKDTFQDCSVSLVQVAQKMVDSYLA